MKVKPMLAVDADVENLKYPVLCSDKLDGIRCIILDGVAYSRGLKPIRNKYVQELFGREEFNGLDGELIVGGVFDKDVFQKTTSGVMSEKGTPDVTFYVFDHCLLPETPYTERLERAREVLEQQGSVVPHNTVKCLESTVVSSHEQLQYMLQDIQEKGGEGVILRSLDSGYKYGRSTLKQGWLLKVKFFLQDEFEVIGFEERMHNENEATVNELGYTERSSTKDGLVPMNTLGSIILRYGGSEFKCGTGFSDTQRQEIWDNMGKYLGKLASIRYMRVGAKDKPRSPSFQGFRDTDDMSK